MSALPFKRVNPSIIVIFGFSGDLAQRYLIPALYHLQRHGYLDSVEAIFGVGSRPLSHEAVTEKVTASIQSCCTKEQQRQLAVFREKITYVQGNLQDPQDMARLAEEVEKADARTQVCNDRLFYFAVPPSLHESLAEALNDSGFLRGCRDGKRNLRVVIEKPFGSDLISAKRLNEKLLTYFDEEEIYRMDHYLGKETVQNLMVTRFANLVFEPIWNHKYVDHVQITVAESLGVGTRGVFYEETGALRDIIQNHLLQLLAMVAMEQPIKPEARYIHDEKAKVLTALRRIKPDDISKQVIRAQYAGGTVMNTQVVAYTDEDNVDKKSLTETFVAIKAFIDNERWHGVPFYLRTGKRLPKKVSEISIHFKEAPQYMFDDVEANVLSFRLQPDEGIDVKLMAKKPGFGYTLSPVNLDMGYHNTFDNELPGAYERLLLDWIFADKTLFVRSDSLYETWDYVSQILNHWQKEDTSLALYAAGSWGPDAAKALINNDGRSWRLGE